MKLQKLKYKQITIKRGKNYEILNCCIDFTYADFNIWWYGDCYLSGKSSLGKYVFNNYRNTSESFQTKSDELGVIPCVIPKVIKQLKNF